MNKVVPPVKPYFPDKDIDQIKSDVEKILRSGMLTMYNYTRDFEKKFAEKWRINNAIALNSGTSALEIALRAFKLKISDEILVPTNTFSASAAAVIFAGGKPVLTDIDNSSLCIDVENVQKYLTKKTKGVIAVHIGGLICPEIREIKEICEDKDLFLIEDAAHAHGSTFNKEYAGTFGDVGCFSFYPTKVMTTGEGGMIITNNDEIAKTAYVLRDQGKENYYSEKIIKLGYNWRLPEIGAAIGLIQLNRIDEIIEKRNKIAKEYDDKLKNINDIKPLKVPKGITSCYYKYICFLNPELNQAEIKKRLRDKGVRCGGEVYWPPLHLQPIYMQFLGTKKGDFPVSENICRRQICLPMYTNMNLDDIHYVIAKIKETFSEI